MQVQIPDFVGGIQRQQALAQQGEMSRLQALALQQAADSQTRFNDAMAAAGPGLLSGSGPAFESALTALAMGGQQGLAMALPLIQQQRSRREALDFWGSGGGGGGAPAVDVQPAPSGPAAPVGDAEAAARDAARERAALDPNAPDYVERLQAINDRLLLAHGPRGGSTSRTTATTVAAMPGWDDGIPAPGAVTRAPAAPVVPVAASAGGAPAGGRSGVSEAEIRRIEMGLAHPSEEIRRQAQSRLQMLQFRMRDNGGEPLEPVEGPDGRPVLVPRSQAAGRTPVRIPSTVVNNNNTNGGGDTARVRADTDTLKAINEGVGQVRQILTFLDRAERAVRAVPEGTGAQFLPAIGQAARAVGIDVPGTSEAEILRGITTTLASLQRVPGSGATTDFEMRLYMQAVPRLGNTRDGNLQLIDFGRRLAQRRLEEANIWRRHAGSEDLIERLDALGPVFNEQERAALAPDATPAPANQQPPPPGVTHRFNPATGRIEAVR